MYMLLRGLQEQGCSLRQGLEKVGRLDPGASQDAKNSLLASLTISTEDKLS